MVDYSSKSPTEDTLQAEYAIKGRVHLKMQWPALVTLGLMAILFPIIARSTAPTIVNAVLAEHLSITFVGVLLLLHGLMILWFTVDYGVKPGFSWRAGITIFTFLVAYGVLRDPFNLDVPLGVSVASYIFVTSIYLLVEGKAVFTSENSKPLFRIAGLGVLLAFSLTPDLPMPDFWQPPIVLGLYYLLLAYGIRAVARG